MKKKIIIAVIITLAILVVGGGVLALTMLSPKPAPLSNPTGLQVIELQDGTKKIYVDRHTNASGYLFSVQKVGETETQSTQGPANEFNANTLLATPATYKISCQYVGSDANYKSQKVEITYKSTITLDAPQLSLGTNENAGKLLLSTTSHYEDALNFKYKLIYASGSEIKTSENFTTIHTNNHGLASLEFDLTTIITAPGAYSLSVQISAVDNEYYLPALTNQILYIVE